MPDLPIRFNPARVIQFSRRLLPSLRSEEPTALAPELAGELPTPRLAFVFLILFIFFSYAQLAAWLPGYSQPGTGEGVTGAAYVAVKMRLSFYTALFAFAGVVMFKQSRGERFLFTGPQTWLSAMFIVCGLISVPFSVWPSDSLHFVLTGLLNFFFIFLLTINVVRNVRSIRTLLWAIALCGCIPAIGTLLGYYFFDYFSVLDQPRDRMGWAGVFINPNSIARAMSLLIPVGFCLIELSETFRKKAFAFCLIVLYGFTMLKMLSRGSMLAVAAIAVVYVASSRNKVRNGLIALVFAVGGIIAVPQVVGRARTIAHYERDASAMGRIQLWRAGIKMAMQRPLWGVGVHGFNAAAAGHFPQRGTDRGLRWKSPHSSYVQVLAEMGFPGLFVFLGLVGVALRDLRRAYKRLGGVTAPGAPELARTGRALFLALLAISLVGLTSNDAYSWSLHMLIGLSVCMKVMARRYGVNV